MTRFVELPIVSDRGSTIWVNPDHVVAVEASVGEEKSFLLTEMGHRPHIALSQEAVVECLDPPPTGMSIEERKAVLRDAFPGHRTSFEDIDEDVDLRDSVRENLQR